MKRRSQLVHHETLAQQQCGVELGPCAEQSQIDVMTQLGLSLHKMKFKIERKQERHPTLFEWIQTVLERSVKGTPNIYEEELRKRISNDGILARRVYQNGTQYNIVQDLKAALLQEWDSISVAELQKLVASMPNRMFEVIQNHGGETSY
uniref:Uncharacterized protein n=1 Tax=Caenorhabditis japonica TaxID=281687 RepID=A0A8R1ILE8_CAEJA